MQVQEEIDIALTRLTAEKKITETTELKIGDCARFLHISPPTFTKRLTLWNEKNPDKIHPVEFHSRREKRYLVGEILKLQNL